MITPKRHADPPPGAPAAPDRRARRRAAIAVGLAALGLAARGQIERAAGERLTEAAGRRGWSVSWSSLRLGGDLSLRLQGIEARGPEGSRVALDALEARWSLADLLEGERAPREVVAEGLDGEVLGGDARRLGARAPGGPAEGVAGARGAEAGPAGKSAPITRIGLKGGALTVRGLPGLEPVKLDGIIVEGGPSGGGWGARVEGRCAQGCGAAQRARGQVAWEGGAVSASLDLDEPSPLQIAVPGSGQRVDLSIQRVDLALEGGALRIGVGDVDVPFERGGWRGQLHVDRASILAHGIEDLRRPEAVRLDGPTLSLRRADAQEAPGEGGDRRDRVDRALALIEGLATGAEGAAGEPPGRALIARLSPLEIRGGRVTLEDHGVTITAVEAGAHEGGYRISGEIGEVGVSATLDPEAPHLSLSVEGLPLAALAGWGPIAEGLAAFKPLRRIDGVVSGRVALEVERDAVAPAATRRRAAKSMPDEAIDVVGLRVRGALKVQRGVLDVKGLTAAPIEVLEADLELDATWWPPSKAGDALKVRSLAVALPSRRGGSVSLRASGELKDVFTEDRRPAAALRVWLDEVDCDVAVSAIPRAMLAHLHDQIALEGVFAPELRLEVDMNHLNDLKLRIEGLPGTCRVTDLGRYSPDHLAERFAQEVREGVTKEGIFVGPDSGAYVSIDATTPVLQAATYVTEEGRFYQNKGFDLKLIRGAVRLNLERGRYAYGGSTISQQLVKNLFMTRNKTLSRKLEEAFIVWRMEEVLTKDRILELYMNCIEYGPNLYGIKRAAEHYFGKKPQELTILESTFLSAIKPHPWIGEVYFSKGHTPTTGRWPVRMVYVLDRLASNGHITPEERAALVAPYVVTFRSWQGPQPAQPGAAPGEPAEGLDEGLDEGLAGEPAGEL